MKKLEFSFLFNDFSMPNAMYENIIFTPSKLNIKLNLYSI